MVTVCGTLISGAVGAGGASSVVSAGCGETCTCAGVGGGAGSFGICASAGGIGSRAGGSGRGGGSWFRATVTGLSRRTRSEEHTSELQSLRHLVCRLLLAT